jgi:Methyltransferase domain
MTTVILQSQGQLSRLIVRGFEAAATQRPELMAALRQPGAFLDIGTGVGRLAIEAARCWPAIQVVGIDPFQPALALARNNIRQSGPRRSDRPSPAACRAARPGGKIHACLASGPLGSARAYPSRALTGRPAHLRLSPAGIKSTRRGTRESADPAQRRSSMECGGRPRKGCGRPAFSGSKPSRPCRQRPRASAIGVSARIDATGCSKSRP